MEVGVVKQQKKMMGIIMEETELRLGIGNTNGEVVVRKRGFCETESEDEDNNNEMNKTDTEEEVDLMLNLSSNPKEKLKPLLPPHPAKPPPKYLLLFSFNFIII